MGASAARGSANDVGFVADYSRSWILLLSNHFTRHFGLHAPTMQAPIGGVAGPELVSAVCNAGTLGALPIWLLPLDAARGSVERTRSMTDGPDAVDVRADLPLADHVAAAVDGGAAVRRVARAAGSLKLPARTARCPAAARSRQ